MRTSLDRAETKNLDNNDFLNLFKNFNITAPEQDIDDFVFNVNESSHVF